jgi:hypothetical protein
MYDGYVKAKELCVIATHSSGSKAVRISTTNYSHAVIEGGCDTYNGQAWATFHRREDLAIRKQREMAKRYPQYSFEVVATQDVRSSEGRRLKRLLKLEKIQRDIEVVALAEVVGDYLDDKHNTEIVSG